MTSRLHGPSPCLRTLRLSAVAVLLAAAAAPEPSSDCEEDPTTAIKDLKADLDGFVLDDVVPVGRPHDRPAEGHPLPPRAGRGAHRSRVVGRRNTLTAGNFD